MTDTTDMRTPRQRGDTDAPHMSSVTPAEDARSIMLNDVSWGAIFAGAVMALVVQVVLNLLGVGIGMATLDPGTGDNPGLGAFGTGAAIWFAVSTILAALIGGIAAGRLSGRPKASTAAWHGVTSWAVSTLFVVYLLGSGIGALVGGTVSTLGNVVGGVASGAGSAIQGAGSAIQAAAPANPFDAIENQIRGVVPADADPAAARDAAIAAVRTAVTGTEAEADQARAQAAQALAQAQGIPVPEAEAQVQQYQDQFTQSVESAKQTATEAADTAAAAATTGALLAALILALGALAGWFGGRMGTVEPTVTAGRRMV